MNDYNDYRKLSALMERTMHKYFQVENQPRSYGPGVMLTQTEIHTIAVVGDRPDINVTELAKVRGVTKGAASQLVYKLVDKGYISKQTSPNSDTEVCLSLTEIGKKAYEGHKKYHDNSGSAFFKALGEMPKDYEDYFIKMLTEFEKTLDDRLK